MHQKFQCIYLNGWGGGVAMINFEFSLSLSLPLSLSLSLCVIKAHCIVLLRTLVLVFCIYLFKCLVSFCNVINHCKFFKIIIVKVSWFVEIIFTNSTCSWIFITYNSTSIQFNLPSNCWDSYKTSQKNGKKW